MTTSIWTTGLDATGSLYGTKQPLITTGNVWFVDSATGTNSASRGKNEKAPLASLVYAHTLAADGDFIVLASTHSESLTANGYLSVSKRLYVMGQGQSAGIPSPRITLNYPSAVPLEFGNSNSIGCVISNVHFITGTSMEAADVGISVVERVTFDKCYFSCGLGTMMRYYGAAGGGINRDCTYLNTRTTTAAGLAIYMAGSSSVEFDRLTLDAGNIGWLNGIALDALTGGVQTDLRITDVTLLRGSDIDVYPTSTGFYNVSAESTGQGRVHW